IQLQKLSPVLVELDEQVAADRVKDEIDKAITDVAKNASVRGIGPGKAPSKELVHLIGSLNALEEATRLVDDTSPKAHCEYNVQRVSQPAIEPQKLGESQPFTYKARVEIVPEIESVKYDGLEAKRPKLEVTGEGIQEQLEALRREHATLEPPPEARPAQAGDV